MTHIMLEMSEDAGHPATSVTDSGWTFISSTAQEVQVVQVSPAALGI